MKIERYERKAISPIVATVLILAATLIAFAAVVGYIFGLFGTATNSANIAVTGSSIKGSTGTLTSLTFTCATSATAPDIVLTNTGTGAASVTGASLTFGGSTYVYPAPTATCTVAAGATQYLNLASDTGMGASGNAYTGTVTLSNGEIAQFTGVFQ
ncbi:MAG: type IV pilin N-terminal domain-containing protein [Nitrososphaerota archaeon]|jgi:flagellin-like protein|nr:type IV pilin N-terminal domain-containing protein [Nitrososphaerota archaeon]MDG6948845.1 type IV pilin N-terminal domain-containing protein [Nitrososphaerota archaeon]